MEGTPSPETDQAWEKLLLPSDGLIQASYANGVFADGLPDTVQSKYHPELNLYGLEVFHQLHCLNRIRQSFHREYYFSNETERRFIHHREHCLNHLRQSIMCSGDVSLDRWVYDEQEHRRWVKTDVPHICRNFNALIQWVSQYQYVDSDWWREGNDD